MEKRGSLLIWVMIIIAIIIFGGVLAYIFLSDKPSVSDTADTVETEGDVVAENESIVVEPEPSACSDYQIEGDCETDSEGFGNCIWDINSSSCNTVVEEVDLILVLRQATLV